MVMPIPSQVTTHSHRLSENIGPDSDLMPAYTDSIRQLIQAGIEVVDLRQIFAEGVEKEPQTLMMHRADHHWASGGISAAADELLPRLKSIDGMDAFASNPSLWSKKEEEKKTLNTMLWRNGLWSPKAKKDQLPLAVTLRPLKPMAFLSPNQAFPLLIRARNACGVTVPLAR